MVFLDTCIWIELCGVKSPVQQNEIKQANMASDLLKKLMEEKETIVTCNEQLLEIISVVEKIKMKEYNRHAKASGKKKCGDIKSYRLVPDFSNAKMLCQSVVSDVKHFANVHNCTYTVEDILDRIDLADINDCIYYDYCKNNEIDFYSFDLDIDQLGKLDSVHVLK